MLTSGFSNNYTSGEISDDGWDRTDIQPIAKGFELGENLMVRVAGPLGKRRGFWRVTSALNQNLPVRVIPFVKSVDDALALEFGDHVVRIWLTNGDPLTDGIVGGAAFVPDDAAWDVVAAAVTANAGLAPNGTMTATLFQEDTNTAFHQIDRGMGAVLGGNAYSFSFFAKAAGRSKFKLTYNVSGTDIIDTIVDLTSNTIVSGTLGVQFEDYSDGWVRVFLENWTVEASGDLRLDFGLFDGGTNFYQGDGVSGIYVWGLQAQPGPIVGSIDHIAFHSFYAAADVAGIRYRQVGDVIYLRHVLGYQPQVLTRVSNTHWTMVDETFLNGPWLAENGDATSTISVTGADETDANAETGAGSILVGAAVTLTATADLFSPSHVGSTFRLRAGDGSPGVKAWQPGVNPGMGEYCLSNGYVYVCPTPGSTKANVATPPTQSSGSQSDGDNMWDYRHDGAGIVRLTGFTDAQHVTGVVEATVPLLSGVASSYWSECAYSNFRGWPRIWPSVREERIVEGSTAADQDILDLTETAGFDPTSESFHPGLGTGQILDTDAVRRRIGDDGAQILWSHVTTYLLVGTASAEYLVAGSVLDEAITPSSVVVKTLSDFGSEDVYPAKAHKGLLFVARGGQTLREMVVDTSQNATSDDLTVLAQHIATRGLAQLAWTRQPDETLWVRLADGGVAALVYHQEQQVRGWSSQRLAGGFVLEDAAVLPGPGKRDTVWIVVSRVKGGATQRQIWMLSQPSDDLFMDAAEFYAGVPATTIEGLDHLEGETVRILADGAQLPDQLVSGGAVHLAAAASVVNVGLPYKVKFRSLKLDVQTPAGGTLNTRQRLVAAIVCAKTVGATVGVSVEGRDPKLSERMSGRQPGDIPAAVSRRQVKEVSLAADTDRDPRIVIEEDSAYDFVLYSIKPKVAAGG